MSDVKLADTVRLNVGGTSFMTNRATLCKYPASMLGAMFRGDIPAAVDETGAYFIDRDGSLFGYILNFLRSSQLKVPEGFAHLEQLAVEAEFFQREPLTVAVNSLLHEEKVAASTQHQKVGCTLEIIELYREESEVCDWATKHPMPSVKTFISGRGSAIKSLPRDFFEDSPYGQDFTKIQLRGSNVRLRLGEYLRGKGWQFVTSDQSSSSVTLKTTGSLQLYIRNGSSGIFGFFQHVQITEVQGSAYDLMQHLFVRS